MHVLEVKIQTDVGELTLRDFLKELLQRLWAEGEGFSGKRPLGDSGWQSSVGSALVKAGLLEGEIDPTWDTVKFDWDELNRLMTAAIAQL